MEYVDLIESSRLKAQQHLDSSKTQAERNKLGQFATPGPLAKEVLEYARKILPSNLNIRFLDPAVGTGSFYSALLKTFLAHGSQTLRAMKSINILRSLPRNFGVASFCN